MLVCKIKSYNHSEACGFEETKYRSGLYVFLERQRYYILLTLNFGQTDWKQPTSFFPLLFMLIYLLEGVS